MSLTPSNSPEALERLIRQRVEALSYLPTTAAVAMKFVELGKDPEADPAEYGKVISSDSSLSTKLLALANSSWFGVRNKVTRPNVAVNLLGLGTVRTLAISYCLTGLHNDLKLDAQESLKFWSASLCKAVAAKQFAAHFDSKAGEEAFAAGLFQDFAIPIMYAVEKECFNAMLSDVTISTHAQLERERAMFRLDHAEIGRLVAQKLELPDLFVDGVAFHHNHAQLGEFVEKPALANAMYVGSLFPHVLDKWNRDDAAELRTFVTAQTAGKPLEVDAFMAEVQKEFNQLYAYFEGGKTPDLKLAELLEMATKEVADNTTRLMGTVHEMMKEVASAGKEVHQVLARSSELEEAALRDPLTGAFNREGLAKKAGELLSQAGRYSSPFAVAYMDLDHFKPLNDSLGHKAGDNALKKLAEVVKEAARPTDVFARLGGDEFALIMGDCSDSTAGDIVQKVIERFAATAAPPVDGKPSATVSVGLLCVTGRGQVMPLDPLLTAADKLMYRAKGAGGNQLYKRTLESTSKAA